jgi:glycosyltransferase involved in cell wall biosynthesis
VLAGGADPEVRVPLERLSRCESQGAPLFEFLGPVAHEKSLALQRSAFVLILFVNRGINTHGTIPGKIFEYIAARRPILAIADSGDAADIVRCGRLGWVVPHETAAIAAFLERFLSNPDRMISETYQPDWTYLNRFDETVMAAQVAEALEAAANSGARGTRQ